MPGTPDRDTLDRRDILARIDRQRAEIGKSAAEQRELSEESQKLASERMRLMDEADTLRRDRGLVPWTLAFLKLGAAGGLIAGVSALLRPAPQVIITAPLAR